jgi:hypothetical protein
MMTVSVCMYVLMYVCMWHIYAGQNCLEKETVQICINVTHTHTHTHALMHMLVKIVWSARQDRSVSMLHLCYVCTYVCMYVYIHSCTDVRQVQQTHQIQLCVLQYL